MHASPGELAAADLRGTLLVRDCLEAGGAFLLVQLVKLVLEGPPGAGPHRRVVLLAAAQAAAHYAAVLRKAGLHLPSLLEAGRLAIVDLLPALGGSSSDSSGMGTASAQGLPCLRTLHQHLAAAAGGGGGGVCLVADDLTVRRPACQA